MAAAALGYAWWVTALRPFTRPALLAVAAGGLAAIGVGARSRPRSGPKTPAVSGGAVWALLLAAAAAWELASFLQHPRAGHPTLSSLATSAFRYHVIRAGAFLAWLGGGAGIAR